MSKYVRFDWALKKLLRNKANFDILEGFLTSLLKKEIKINSVLESEGNKSREDEKSNRVDLLCEDKEGTLFLFEVQVQSETSYFQRMLFGTSRLVTDYTERGKDYGEIRKIYSINIVYFRFWRSKDFVYHGTTEFRGLHDSSDILDLSPYQKEKFKAEKVSDIYPEYYILKADDFNRWSKDSLEQWIYFLSTSEIPEDATAPGLQAAREKMKIETMSREEQDSYFHHLDDAVVLVDNIKTARNEGILEGREEGKEEEKIKIAKNLKKMGLDIEPIKIATGLSELEIEKL